MCCTVCLGSRCIVLNLDRKAYTDVTALNFNFIVIVSCQSQSAGVQNNEKKCNYPKTFRLHCISVLSSSRCFSTDASSVCVHVHVWKHVLLCAVPLLGPVWSHRQAHAVRPWPGGALHKVREGTDRDRTELRQATQVGLCELVSECYFVFTWLMIINVFVSLFIHVCVCNRESRCFFHIV